MFNINNEQNIKIKQNNKKGEENIRLKKHIH